MPADSPCNPVTSAFVTVANAVVSTLSGLSTLESQNIDVDKEDEVLANSIILSIQRTGIFLSFYS